MTDQAKEARVEQLWSRIEAWLIENASAVAAGLNPPASPRELADTERVLGVQFPQDVRDSYLRHDGQTPDSPEMFEGWEWLSLKDVRSQWKVWKSLVDRGCFAGKQSDADGLVVRKDWWNPAWIPLTYVDTGDHLCVDLAPGPQGTPGQIIEMWHDWTPRPVVAASFREWLSNFADDLQTGKMMVCKEYGDLYRRKGV